MFDGVPVVVVLGNRMIAVLGSLLIVDLGLLCRIEAILLRLLRVVGVVLTTFFECEWQVCGGSRCKFCIASRKRPITVAICLTTDN